MPDYNVIAVFILSLLLLFSLWRTKACLMYLHIQEIPEQGDLVIGAIFQRCAVHVHIIIVDVATRV